ncbi:MAG: MATE family efflux transporter [Deltaproteobacteria bacterium]|nr:MAG: MATE family efflux transporter [Deltaproteobacteria bacterium]
MVSAGTPHPRTFHLMNSAENACSSPADTAAPRGFLWTIGGLGVDPERAKTLLVLAGPVILGMLTQTAVNLVDTAMVGRLPSAVAVPGQAALGISLPFYWAVGGFLSSIQVGTQAIVSRRFGEGKRRLAGRALMNSLCIAFVSAAVTSIIAIVIIPYVFPFFHGDPDVIRLGVPYLQVRMVGVISMVATAGVKAFFDGIGRTYVHMVAAITMNLINIFGNWVLIFGNLGAPRLEVTGAAIASTVSTYIGLGIMLVWTFRREIRARFRPYRLRNLNLAVGWDIVRLSVPSGVATVAMMAAFLLFLKIVGHLDMEAGHGAIFSAATKVVIDILSITFMSCIAFGTAAATMVGQSMGRKEPRLAELYGWEAVKLGAYLFGAIGLLTAIWPQIPLSIFSEDASVIHTAIPIMRLLGAFEWAVAAAMILMQAMFGAGNSKFVMYVELLLHFTCLVPLAYLLGVVFDLQLFGMWVSGVVYVVSAMSIIGWKFYQGKWKSIAL